MSVSRLFIAGVLALAGLAGASGCGSTRTPDAAATPVPDFSGVWESPSAEYVTMVDDNHPKFTAAAQANLDYYRKHFDPVRDDPANVCLLKGMPWTMLLRPRNYPVEIYQTADRIVMSFELYDTYRNIFLDRDQIPDDVPPSGNGYSIGRFEGDALVVETGQLTALNPIGPYQRSEQARVIERWTLRQHPTLGQTLHVDITVRDPAVYAEPGRGEMLFKRSSPGTRVGGYNCSETLWDEYVKRRREEIEARVPR